MPSPKSRNPFWMPDWAFRYVAKNPRPFVPLLKLYCLSNRFFSPFCVNSSLFSFCTWSVELSDTDCPNWQDSPKSNLVPWPSKHPWSRQPLDFCLPSFISDNTLLVCQVPSVLCGWPWRAVFWLSSGDTSPSRTNKLRSEATGLFDSLFVQNCLNKIMRRTG